MPARLNAGPQGVTREKNMTITAAATLQPLAAMTASFAASDNDERAVQRHALRLADLESFRSALTHYARRWLRNAADVEDVVQDTLTAAMESHGFAGRSSAATWLHGILKHKIVDMYRRQARMPLLDTAPDSDEADDGIDALFRPDGSWRTAPKYWPAPEAALESRELSAIVNISIGQLPKATARAFLMRELMGMEVAEICEVLGVTANHCYVMLFRARMRLRVLIERHWLGSEAVG